MKQVELAPVKDDPAQWDELESIISDLFKREIYLPLIREFKSDEKLENSQESLLKAIRTGRLVFYRGAFKGKLNATLTKELRRLGAKWDRRQGCFKVPVQKLPLEIRDAIEVSESRFKKMAQRIDERLAKLLPEKIAAKLKVEKFFDSVLWKADQSIKKTLKGITVTPELTKRQRAKIAEDYTKNMELSIKEWSEKEITSLRKKMQTHVFEGGRPAAMVETIQKSYGVSQSKAKFLARQETNLLMAKFKESRYQESGVNWYKWYCVVGSKNHPVRPMHKKLEGKEFRWDDPPIVNENGDKKNPGEDYNCRCFARPIVKFK